jgi:hypothetical protein
VKAGRVLLWVGLGCGVLLLGAVATVGGCFYWVTRSPEGIEVSIEAPSEVRTGERFVAVARVRNTSDRAQTLNSIDVADEYLRGIVIERTVPAYRDAFHVPIDDTVAHGYDLVIAPGGEQVVTFELLAAHAGDWSGDFDFCINSDVHFVPWTVRTVVRSDAPAGN